MATTDKFTLTTYKLVLDPATSHKIVMHQSFFITEAEAVSAAKASGADYAIVNDLQNAQVYTQGTLPVLPAEPEAKPIVE